LKLLLGFNSKDEVEEGKKKHFSIQSWQKTLYSKKRSYGFKYINTVFIHLVSFCKLIFKKNVNIAYAICEFVPIFVISRIIQRIFFFFYIIALSNILEVASIVQCAYFYKRTKELEKKKRQAQSSAFGHVPSLVL